MKKLYLFLTCDIHDVGGAQLYIQGKSKYLERNNYKVIVFHYGIPAGKSKYPYLNKYIKYGCPIMRISPNELPTYYINWVVEKIKKEVDDDYEEILIESNEDIEAIWGEIIAQRLKCKHIVFCINEIYRGENKKYVDYIEFYRYKLRKKELYLCNEDFYNDLFEGEVISKTNRLHFHSLEDNPVQDINNVNISKIKKRDYNILYLGRTNKLYVNEVIDEVFVFAKNNSDKKINFIIIGDKKNITKKIKSLIKASRNNIEVTYLGELSPIPKSIFKKIDVAICGSGCAECASREFVPTIIVDCHNYKSNGVIGYTVFNCLAPEKDSMQRDINQSIDDVLKKRICDNLPFINLYEFNSKEVDNTYSEQINAFKLISNDEYYDILGHSTKTKTNRFKFIYYIISSHFPIIGLTIHRIINILFK